MALCSRVNILKNEILRCPAVRKPVANQHLATRAVQRYGRSMSATVLAQKPVAASSATPPQQLVPITDRLRMMRAVDARPAGFGLQSAFYQDSAFFRADVENLWQHHWIFAGHDCELTSAKDTITMQIAEHPVSIVRNGDEKHRAFCTTQLGLKSIAVDSAAGYIFVSLAEEPQPFRPVATMMESYLAPFDLRTAKVAHQSRIIEKGNWKMVWENNRECYHCRRNHNELVKSFPDGAWWNGLSGTPEEMDQVRRLVERCEALGFPSNFVSSWDGQYRIMRIPLTNDARSFTPDTEPAVVSKRLGLMPMDDVVGDVLFYHYPNTWNHFLADHALSFRVLPISPTETEVVTKWLVPEDAVEGVDYTLDNLTKVWNDTNAEDAWLVERNQLGVMSPAYQPGPYNTLHEDGVSQFVDWYCNATKRSLMTSASSSTSLQEPSV